MPLDIDNGRRSISVDVDLFCTAEQAWRAVATGVGVSSWFLPTEIEERIGGKITTNFGPGMESRATIKEWQPPQRLLAQSNGLGPDAPPLFSEWSILGETDLSCTVRVTHYVQTDSDAHDAFLLGTETGWPKYFRILEIYSKEFINETSAAIRLSANTDASVQDVWSFLIKTFCLTDLKVGEMWSSPGDLPLELSGTVEHMANTAPYEVVVKLDTPAQGVLDLEDFALGDRTYVTCNLFFFGDSAAFLVEQAERHWQKWFADLFS